MSNSDGWVKHDGKGYPGFTVGTKLLIRYRDEMEVPKTIREDQYQLAIWTWDEADPTHDILYYKVLS